MNTTRHYQMPAYTYEVLKALFEGLLSTVMFSAFTLVTMITLTAYGNAPVAKNAYWIFIFSWPLVLAYAIAVLVTFKKWARSQDGNA